MSWRLGPQDGDFGSDEGFKKWGSVTSLQVIWRVAQGRIVGPAEATAECCRRLALHNLFNLLSHTAQNHEPSSGPSDRGLGPLTTIINKENDPTDVSTGQSDEGNSQVKFPFPR